MQKSNVGLLTKIKKPGNGYVWPEELQTDGNETNNEGEKSYFHHLLQAVPTAQLLVGFCGENATGWLTSSNVTLGALHGYPRHWGGGLYMLIYFGSLHHVQNLSGKSKQIFLVQILNQHLSMNKH